MTSESWKTKPRAVASLYLDEKNPRLGGEITEGTTREIIQYLFDHDNALEVADSIASRGFFPNEPLLVVKEGDRLVVIEGNRRLAALKALREPDLLEGTKQGQVKRLSHKIVDIQTITKVPVTLAPSRRETDRQIVGRHIGTPVLAWTAENRASFILEKLGEGYDNDDLRDKLGFTLTDIQKARQTRAIADMARSIDLPDKVKAQLENPRAKIFSTIGRIIDSSVGRKYLKIEKDPDYGLRGLTTKNEFIRGFKKLVTDVALKNESSRSLNTNENIEDYFKKMDSKDLPQKKRGSFIPSDIIKGKTGSLLNPKLDKNKPLKKSKQINKMVLPRDFKVRYGNDRLIDIRDELIRLERERFPNAGAVLLRVFLELSVLDFLKRTGELPKIIEKLKEKEKLPPSGMPKMGQLIPGITRIAKNVLQNSEAKIVEKALRYDPSAPFTLSDLNAFVHHVSDPPDARGIWQFWIRTEPLFRLMLEQDVEGLNK